MGVADWVLHLWYNSISGEREEEKASGNSGKISLNRKMSGFQMPLQYPRFKKSDYEKMDEGRLRLLLGEYGLQFKGSLDELRAYAIGTFLWPDQV